MNSAVQTDQTLIFFFLPTRAHRPLLRTCPRAAGKNAPAVFFTVFHLADVLYIPFDFFLFRSYYS